MPPPAADNDVPTLGADRAAHVDGGPAGAGESAGMPPHERTGGRPGGWRGGWRGGRSRRRPLIALSATVLALAALAALWRLTPLSRYANVDGILDWAQTLATVGAAGPAIMVALFIVGGFLMFPVTVMIAVTAIVLGSVVGFATALAGSLAAAAALFGAGRAGGRDMVRRFGGRTVNRISRRMADSGVLTVAILRIVPVAPFTVVNLVAGASHLRFTQFMLGTVIGMGPGVLAFSLFGSRIEQALRNPTPGTVAVAAAIGAVAIGLGWVANRILGLYGRCGKRHRKNEETA